MATTSLWRIRGRLDGVLLYAGNSEKTTLPVDASHDALEDVILYAERESATNKMELVSRLTCTPETAREEMMRVKRKFRKEDGTVAYHGYQSFAEGEVTAEIAHKIGVELAERLWGDRFQVLIATHLDKESHIHNHFVINTVSFVDGRKFHRTKEDYKRMQEESDRLYLEYGLSVIENQTGIGKHYKEYFDENRGVPTIRGQIREDVDRAISVSLTEREFYANLVSFGYEIKLLGESGKPLKYPALKPQGAKGFFRFHKLGKGYDLESIKERLLENIKRKEPFPGAEFKAAVQYRKDKKPKKLKGLHALYIRYCFELGIIKRYPASAKQVSFFMKEDLTRLEKLDEQTRFLGNNNIETIDDLNHFKGDSLLRYTALEEERKAQRAALKRAQRAGNQEEEKEAKTHIEDLSTEMKKIRKSLALFKLLLWQYLLWLQALLLFLQMEIR